MLTRQLQTAADDLAAVEYALMVICESLLLTPIPPVAPAKVEEKP